MTVNGMIATKNDDTPWSQTIWDNYYHIAKKFKALVIGRRSFEIMQATDEFKKIGNPLTIVLSTKATAVPEGFLRASSPRQALSLLKERGFKKALLGGGAATNAAFMEEDLVDEVYIDIEPAIFGKGIPLFASANFMTKLRRTAVQQREGGVMHIRYKVVHKKKHIKTTEKL